MIREGGAPGTEPPAELEAVEPGHQDVEHDEIGEGPLEGLPRGLAVGEGLDLVARPSKGEPEGLADRCLVIDHRDHAPGHRHGDEHGVQADRRSRKLPATNSPQLATNVPRRDRRRTTSISYNQPGERASSTPHRARRCVMRVGFVTVWLVIVALLTGPAGASAQEALPQVTHGSLLVRSRDTGRLEEVPELKTEVLMRVTGLIARVEVTQNFHNPTAQWLEGIYVFPLPEGAAVDALRLHVGERIIEGQIHEREEARQAYQKAHAEGTKASLLEQERPNIFTTSVANIGPGEDVAVTIQYQELIRYDQGEFRLRFPLVVGPRYIPGDTAIDGMAGTGWGVNTTAVLDAARITPPVRHPSDGPINPVSLTVELDAGLPLRRLESPYHPIITMPMSATQHAITLASGAVPADRDFELVWAPDVGQEPAAAVFTQSHEGEHYALVMLLPPAGAAPATRLPRETIFVVDTSGSMAGASIQQAKAALGEALDALGPGDRFNVIQFNSITEQLFPATVPAGPAEIARARQWVQALRANGGTEMLPALRAALEGDTEQGAVRQVVFITDGLVGNENQLFGYISRQLGRSRLFTVGIGSAPNGHFMTKAAPFGRGTYTYIGSPTEVGEKMGALFRKLESPVLTDVQVSWSSADVEAWPARVPDLYAGEPVVLVARLGADPGGELRVSGKRGGRNWDGAVRVDGSSEESGVHKLWARKKISGLIDRLRESPNQDEVRTEVRSAVLAVALRHHLVSAYTSLVAVDVTPTRPAGTPGATANVPVNLPAGMVYEKIFGGLPQTATPGPLYLLVGLASLALALLLARHAFAPGVRA
jgi:Ca-activated chloride channel family protein